MKNILWIVTIFMIACSKPQLSEPKAQVSATDHIVAPDLRILEDTSYGANLPGALLGTTSPLSNELYVYSRSVSFTSGLHQNWSIPTGQRIIMETNCPIVNEPKIETGEYCGYSWYVSNSETTVNPVNGYLEFPDMLSIEIWQQGNLISYREKKGYNFGTTCLECVRTGFMGVCPYTIDHYKLYTHIDSIQGDIVIVPTVNFKGRWTEQDYSNNSVQIPVRIAGISAQINSEALSQLQPIAPFNIRRVKNAYTWEGSGEWWEVDGVRVDSRIWTGKRPKTIASVNRYFRSETPIRK